MIRVMIFDRQGQPVGELPEGEVFGLVRKERVNGEHSLTITTSRVLQQGWRILTRDARGKWREHVVYGTDALHDSGDRPFGTYYCVWSLQADLMGTRISSMPGVQNPVTASVALEHALAGTSRWAKGTVTNTATGGASMYDTNGWHGLSVLVENWGGELDADITVGSSGVVTRKVDLYAKQGDQEPRRRYDFGADLKSVRRRIADGPLYCRITPRGMGEESGDGYGRRITIAPVNDGKDWLENSAMVDLAKLPDGSGGWEYPTLEVENSECETPADLKVWGLSVLDEYTTPKISYEIDVLQLAREGVDMHGVSLGDAVHIVDRRFGDGLRTSGRALEVTVNMLDEADMQLVVGSIASDLADLFGGLGSRLSAVTETVKAVNGGTLDAADYLERLIGRLNAEANATGGYTYITQGQGIRTYDAAVTDPLVGAEASKVVEVKGGTIRIADTKTAQGAWEWKTLIASGLVASEVLSASNIVSGALVVRDALNNTVFEADIDAGTVRMAGDSVIIGQRTLGDAVDVVWGTAQQVMTAGQTSRWEALTAQFSPNDDTVLKLRWTGIATSYTGEVTRSMRINGSSLPSDLGSTVRIPAGTSIAAGAIVVARVEHHDASNPDRWRWYVDGVESSSAAQAQAARSMFARDTSSVEINAGTVTFNSNTFVVNSTNFSVTSTGVVTAKSGTIGGMSLANDHIYNESLDLTGTGLSFLLEGETVGSLNPLYLVDDPTAQNPNLLGILNLHVPYQFQVFSKVPSGNDTDARIINYEKKSNYTNGLMEILCDTKLSQIPNITGTIMTTITVPRLGDSGYNYFDVVSGLVTAKTESPGTNFLDIAVTISGKKMTFKYGRLTKVENV